MANASNLSTAADELVEPLLGVRFTSTDCNSAWLAGLLTVTGLSVLVVGFFAIYASSFATPEGHDDVRTRAAISAATQEYVAAASDRLAAASGRLRIHPQDEFHKDDDCGVQATVAVYEALHPFFKGDKGSGKFRPVDTTRDGNADRVGIDTTGDGLIDTYLDTFYDTASTTESGLPGNRLVAGEFHSEEALRLLTRGISAQQLVDKNGIFRAGADDLQMNPMHFFGLSSATTRIKAFVSHTWDAKGFDPRTVVEDRAEHADQTAKALMWHIKTRPFLVSALCGQLFVPIVWSTFPPLFPLAALVMYGVPLWFVGSTHPTLFRFLGLAGPQFWVDKATVHQANLRAGGEPAGSEPNPPSGFKFVPPNQQISAAQRAAQTSEYRVLNQAGVSLFVHFLEQSDELWVLFTDRYIHRAWCVFELAVWLRLMRRDPHRKIKLIPLSRNAELYRSLPGFQGLVAWLTCFYLLLVGYFAVSQHKDAYTIAREESSAYTSDGVTVLSGIACMVVSWLLFMCVVYQFGYRKYIVPATQERRRIVEQLRDFSVTNLQASFNDDKALVLGMIASMWRPTLSGPDKSDAECLRAFDNEVRCEMPLMLNALMKHSETDLLRIYVVIPTVTVLCGVPYILFSLDLWRPAGAPRLGWWAQENLKGATPALGFGSTVAAVILLQLGQFLIRRHWL